MVPEQDDPVCTYTKPPVAKPPDELRVPSREYECPVVNHDEIIPCAMIFGELDLQGFLLNIRKNTKYL